MVYLRVVRGLFVAAVCLTATFTTSCRNAAERAGGSSDQRIGAALTTTATASSTAVPGDRGKADAFAQQARAFAELAALERAQAASVAATISARPQVITAVTVSAAGKPVAGQTAGPAGTASAPTTSGRSGAGGAPTITAGVPAGAAKYEDHLQKVAALADRLGANAQRLANFHLARVNQSAGAIAKGGAQ